MSNFKELPVEVIRYPSYTYFKTGQPFVGLGAWLRYQERRIAEDRYNAIIGPSNYDRSTHRDRVLGLMLMLASAGFVVAVIAKIVTY